MNLWPAIGILARCDYTMHRVSNENWLSVCVLINTHINRVILGKNHCGVEMECDRLVVEKFPFLNKKCKCMKYGHVACYFTQNRQLVYSLYHCYMISAGKEKVEITTEPLSKLDLGSSRF